MGDLLKKAASPGVLNAAWKRLNDDKAVWGPGVSRADMEKDVVFHMTKLAGELASGAYEPSLTRQFPAQKGDGGQRIISALTLRDKLAQRAVLMVISEYGENIFNPFSFGYRPGRTIDMAVSKAREYVLCGLAWLVDGDIKSFFDRIPHAPLIKEVKKIIPDKDAIRLIEKWLDVGTPKTGILGKRRGIPQGGVLSPFLCNVYLTAFDRHLTSNNLPFVRFADDFLVFCPTRQDADKALAFVKMGLKKLDLEVNENKTKIAQSGPGVVFLGRRMPKPQPKGLPAGPR
jgi:group II intron reverse transcriptase/maturase